MFEHALTVHDADGVTVAGLRVDAALDSRTVQETSRTLNALLDAPAVRAIVLDLAGVGFLPEALVNVLLTLRRRAEQAGVPIVLAALRPELTRLARARRIDKLFQFFETRHAALLHLAPGPPGESFSAA